LGLRSVTFSKISVVCPRPGAFGMMVGATDALLPGT
jgi:hypothetical protein